jgi:hypothetical protein
MRHLPLLALLPALAACGGGVKPLEGGAPQPPAQVEAIPADANVLVVASEAVASQEDDHASYLKVSVDGREAGQTATAPKSREKRWGAVLPAGNHLFRFQAWSQPVPEQWAPLADAWQPPERFIRVEAGLRTVVTLKFSEGGRRHSLQVSREPLLAPR